MKYGTTQRTSRIFITAALTIALVFTLPFGAAGLFSVATANDYAQSQSPILKAAHDTFDVNAYAAAKYKTPTRIKTDSVKKIDLNGGGKETVKLSSGTKSEDGVKVKVYSLKINGKTLLVKEKWPWNISAWNLYYADFNKKDKYKELILKAWVYDDALGYEYDIFRYKAGKLVPIKATFKTAGGFKYKKAGNLEGTSLRIYGDGTFKLKYNYGSIQNGWKPTWITLKIDNNMNVTKK
jgi:hypothetical protein